MGQKSLKKNALLNIVKTLMGMIFPLITFPYASRVLGPDGIGKINFAQSVISYFGLVAGLSTSVYGVKEGAKIRDDKVKFNKLVHELLKINMISTMVAYALFFIALFVVPKFSSYRSLLCVCSATMLFGLIGMDWVYSAQEDYFYITIRSIGFQVLSLCLLFIFVREKDDYLKYATISVISSVGSNILNFIHSRKYISFKKEKNLNLKHHMKPIFMMFGMAVTISIYTILDTTMLGFFTDDYQVGLYSAATKINRIVLSLVTSFSAVVLPRLSYYIGKEDIKKFQDLVYKSIDLLFLLSIPSAIGLSLISEPAIILFSGQEFFNAVPIMRIMNPIIVVVGLGGLLGSQILIPMGKEKYTFISEIVGAISNFTLNLILIPKFKATGAAIATIIAESLVSCTQLFFARKYFKLLNFAKSFLRYLLNTIVMGIFVFAVFMISPNTILKLLLPIIVGVIVYGTLLVIEKNPLAMQILSSVGTKTGISVFFKHKRIVRKLKKTIKPVLEKHKDYKESEILLETSRPIWICWFQGEREMPEIIKICINSIRKSMPKFCKIVLLTKDNIAEYIAIPDYILEKAKTGKISSAHFSDIIRVGLLSKYGGMWMDATLLCTKTIPDEWFSLPLFAGVKFKPKWNDQNISKCKWSTFFMGTNRKSEFLFSFLYDAYLCYWENEDDVIDYFLFDYIIYIAYKVFPSIKKEIDASPYNSPDCHKLVQCLSMHAESEYVKKIWNENTVFKLTYKNLDLEQLSQDKESVYSKLLELYK